MRKQMILLLSLGLSSSTADAQAPLISTGNFFQIDRSYLYKYKIDTSLWAVSRQWRSQYSLGLFIARLLRVLCY